MGDRVQDDVRRFSLFNFFVRFEKLTLDSHYSQNPRFRDERED
jgi:hypothetical protein